MTTDDARSSAFTEDELNVLCSEWQAALRLQDWHIACAFRRHFDMPEPCYGPLEAAQLNKHRHNKSAEIVILDPHDIDPMTPGDIPTVEQSLVHELLHIHLDLWEPEGGTPEYWAMERAINFIADALLALKGKHE